MPTKKERQYYRMGFFDGQQQREEYPVKAGWSIIEGQERYGNLREPPVYPDPSYSTIKKRRSKRKPSAYSKRYGAAYRKLKKQHPRMSFGSLSKKAHKEAKK